MQTAAIHSACGGEVSNLLYGEREAHQQQTRQCPKQTPLHLVLKSPLQPTEATLLEKKKATL